MTTQQPRTDGAPVGPARAAGPARPGGRDPAWPWALAGVAAGVAGTGAAEVASVVGGPSSVPLVAAAQAFIDATPPWLKDAAVRAFGTHDKQVLLGGAGLVLLVLSAGVGVLARRRPGPAFGAVLVLGAVGVVAAVSRPEAGLFSAAPGVVGALAGAIVLGTLRRRALPDEGLLDEGSPDEGLPAGGDPAITRPRPPAGTARRELLLASGIAVAGGAVAGGAGLVLGTAARGAEESRARVRLPAPVGGTPVLPGGVEVGVAGVVPFRVPNRDFYRIDTATLVPRVSTRDWHLRIHGMIEREIRLDWDTLLAGSLVERDVTLICVSDEVGGDLVGNARWLGLPIAPLLRRAGPTAGADMVLSTSADGWTASTPLDVLTDGRDALLAIGMNGEPLPIEHGFPVRMVVPGLYGYVSATKWVTELEVTRFDRDQGYWTSRGWAPRAPVKTQSRIDVPRPGARVRAGRTAVAGVAWAQHRGIGAVEVRVDDDAWRPADLGAEATVDTWRQWVFRWDATPGHHRLAVRATDGAGQVQTGAQAPPAPDGATGWHTIEVDVT